MKAKISNQKGVMMKQLLLLILMVLSLVGCKYEPGVIQKVVKQEQPVLKAVFELPDNWMKREDSDNRAFLTNAKDQPVSFAIGSAYYADDTPAKAENLRDASYKHAYCEPTVQDELKNCAKGFHKKQIKIDDIDVFLLQSYGERFDLDLLATQAYWEKNGEIQTMLITGDFEQAIPALTTVVRTLHYEVKE